MGAEAEESSHRLKRLRMRSWRRGTKEMDLILGPYADAVVPNLSPAALAAYEQLLEENDQDLYPWFAEREAAPARHREILAQIRDFHAKMMKLAKNTAD